MKSTIIKIGNSKGVRIPKALLEESGLDFDVDIKASKGVIKITKAKPSKKPKGIINKEYAASLKALKDWDIPEEDAAWASLQ
jgi:antitoxin MazE